MNYKKLFICLLQYSFILSAFIDDYGAIPKVNTLPAAINNSIAITNTIYNEDDIIIPNETYYTLPIHIESVNDKYIELIGILFAYDNISAWPNTTHYYNNVLEFTNSNDITISGNGGINGQGYNWWWNAIINKLPYSRPNLLVFEKCENIYIDTIQLYNSPQYHINMVDVWNVLIEHITITVTTHLQEQLPIFPLNTDGIDIAGDLVYINNVSITNFDDAIAIKPLNQGNTINCSRNMLIENSRINYGVGMSIGSVSPNKNVNCVENITFQNIEFYDPIKSIYIKTNPGSSGTGIIRNIFYKNIYIHKPIWFNIYIGPQQEKEPNGNGPGCMLYPITDCETQPLITIENITLQNITTDSSVLNLDYIIRCNESNPCKHIQFVNVSSDANDYICENVIDSYGIC